MAASQDAAPLVRRLREEPRWLQRLAAVVVESLLEVPVGEAIAPGPSARRAADALRAAARDPGLEAVLARRLAEAKEQILARAPEAPPAEYLPPALIEAWAEAAARPYPLDPALLHRVLDHEAVRRLIRTVLLDALDGFVTRVLDLLPGGRMLSGLAGRARGIVGGMVGGGTPGSGAGAGGSMQQILEARARDFVDGALGRAVHLVVDFLSDPAHAEMMGRWRRDVVRSLAEQPTRALLGVLEGVDTGAVAGDLVRSLRALAAWEGLDGALEGHLEALAAAYDGESVRGLAEGTDIEGALRPLVEALLAEQMATVVRAQRFADWVQAWVQGEAPQEGGPP